MMGPDILYRLCLMMGFLTAGFIAMLIAGIVIALQVWYRSAMRDLLRMTEELEKQEDVRDERKDT